MNIGILALLLQSCLDSVHCTCSGSSGSNVSSVSSVGSDNSVSSGYGVSSVKQFIARCYLYL